MRLRLCIFIVYTVLIVVLFPSIGQSGQLVAIAFSEFPPYKMIIDKKQTGIDVEILTEIAKRMDLTIYFNNGTFEDCLRMMERGDADLMTSLLRRPEREKYIHYVQPRYRTRADKIFYVRNDRRNLIRSYDDLTHLKIGVKGGVKYAPMFDNNKDLKKIPAPDIATNLRRLLSGEIDTFLDTGTEGDYWIKTLGIGEKVEKAIFKFTHSDSIYLGISQKSLLTNRTKELSRHLKQMVDTGLIQKIVDAYVK
jgi:polar amino acid transport system substrate-binding protein